MDRWSRHVLLIVAFVGLSLGATVGSPPASVAAVTVTVRITSTLEPAIVTVRPGDTVTWRNDDATRHRIRSTSGPDEFDSGDLDPGETFSFTLSTEGTYPYRDARDPELSNYWGSIIVSAAAPSPTPAPGATPTPPASEATVRMAGRAFTPSAVTIPLGGQVSWLNDDSREHTATDGSGAWDSGFMAVGATFVRTFTTAGTFGYLCLIHPDMTGSVTVMPAPGATAPPPPAPTPTPPPAAGDIDVVDFAFAPQALDVAAGARVTFVNRGVALHTVTARDGTFDSGLMPVGRSYSRSFPVAGTYEYFCALHPTMFGTIRVFGLGGGSPPPPASGASPAPRPGAPPGDLRIVDFAFLPSSVTVPRGTTLGWTNEGAAPHTITSRDRSFDSGILGPGTRYRRTFDVPGTFPFLCALHPDMTGTIVVLGAGGVAPPPGTAPPVPGASPGADGREDVRIVDLGFEPATITVPLGAMVHWRNLGVAIHTVTSLEGSFDSGFLATGEAYERRFEVAGTFEYVCALHPSMVGSVVVAEVRAPGPAPGQSGGGSGAGVEADPAGGTGGGAMDPLRTGLAGALSLVALTSGALVVRGVARRAEPGADALAGD